MPDEPARVEARVTHRTVDVTALAVAGLCVGLLFGLSYGVSNQNTYLLAPLRHLDPSFLRRDWLAAHTYAYHPSFTWIIAVLAHLGPLAWTTAVLNLLLTPLTAILIYAMARRISPEDALGATCLVLLAMIVDRTESVGQSYIFGGYLQPSVLASVAFIGAMVCFVQARWSLAGLWLGLSALLHTNFLVVGVLAFGTAQLLLGRRGLVRRMIAQMWASTLVLALDLPVLLRLARGGENSRKAMYVFEVIRSPHHYIPAGFIREMIPFTGWMLLFAAAVVYAVPERAVRRRVVALGCALAIPVVVATAAGLVVPVSRLTQLYLWRLAPFAVLLGQVGVGVAVTKWLRADTVSDAGYPRPLLLAVAGLGAAVVAGYYLRRSVLYGWPVAPAACLFAFACAIPLIGVLRARAPGTLRAIGLAPPRTWLVIPLFLGVQIASAAHEVRWNSNLLHPDLTAPELALDAWAASTPRDAIFMIPPGMGWFRLHTGRAIVVDWKSTPIVPAELMEWYRRISLEAGVQPGSLDDAERGYAAMRTPRLRQLAAEFGADFAVFRRPRNSADSLDLPVVYRNDRFIVYALADTAARATGSRPSSSPAAASGAGLLRRYDPRPDGVELPGTRDGEPRAHHVLVDGNPHAR